MSDNRRCAYCKGPSTKYFPVESDGLHASRARCLMAMRERVEAAEAEVKFLTNQGNRLAESANRHRAQVEISEQKLAMCLETISQTMNGLEYIKRCTRSHLGQPECRCQDIIADLLDKTFSIYKRISKIGENKPATRTVINTRCGICNNVLFDNVCPNCPPSARCDKCGFEYHIIQGHCCQPKTTAETNSPCSSPAERSSPKRGEEGSIPSRAADDHLGRIAIALETIANCFERQQKLAWMKEHQ